MLLLRVQIDLYGDQFNSSEFRKNIKEKFYNDKEEDQDNCMSIECPQRIGIEYELDHYFEWYVKFIEKYFDDMVLFGTEEINLMINVFYSDQCNFEMFNRDMISRLSKFPIAFPISVYETSNKELLEIKSLRKYSVNKS